MDTVKKGWEANQEKISAALETMKQEMDRENVLENDLSECRKKIVRLGREVSEMLCPLVIGKTYKMSAGAYVHYADRSGWLFRVIRLVGPKYNREKWGAEIEWMTKQGKPRTAFGHHIDYTYISSSDVRYIEEIP